MKFTPGTTSRGTDHVFLADILEGEIIFGDMSAGSELIERSLMQRCDAKRHTIRSMIEELIGRGIVVKQRGRSAHLKTFTPIEVDELYHMRAVIHREAVRIMPLPAATADYETAIDAGAPPLQIHGLNDAFHNQLFALSRNTLLCEMIAALNRRSALIRSHGITRPDWLAVARREHAQIILLLERGDRENLMHLVVEHMLPTRRIWEETHAESATMSKEER
jgi:DNA-binding GntR family transcriptional regulator